MGPKVRYLGPEVPGRGPDLAGPGPGRHHAVGRRRRRRSRRRSSAAGFSVGQLVKTAWASASTYRKSDHRGGANGARIRLAPQKDWAVNEPDELARVLAKIDELRGVAVAGRRDRARRHGGGREGGEGRRLQRRGAVHRRPRRRDAGVDRRRQLRGDGAGRPTASATTSRPSIRVKTEELLLDRASLLGLSAPEMTVLLGGLRVLGANHGDAPHGVFTNRKGQLTNDFFVNLLDIDTFWEVVDDSGDEEFIGYDRGGRQEKWRATRTDLIFGSNSQLRATAEVYAEKGNEEKFVRDFVKAWTKVMNADRFDLPQDATASSRSASPSPRWPTSPAARLPRRTPQPLRPIARQAASAGISSRRSREACRRAAGTPPRAGSTGARPARSGGSRGRTAAAGRSTPVPSRMPASIAIAGTKVRPRPLSTICTSVCSEVPIIAASARSSGRLQADSAWSLRQWPSSSSSSRFSSIASASTARAARRFAAREGDEQPIVEQVERCRRRRRRRAWRAARSRAGRGAARRRPPGWSPRAGTASGSGHWLRSRGSIAGSRNGAMVGITPMRSSPVQRLALGARHVGQLLALAQHAARPCRRSSGPAG